MMQVFSIAPRREARSKEKYLFNLLTFMSLSIIPFVSIFIPALMLCTSKLCPLRIRLCGLRRSTPSLSIDRKVESSNSKSKLDTKAGRNKFSNASNSSSRSCGFHTLNSKGQFRIFHKKI